MGVPDLPEVRTVDVGLVAAVLAKFGLDYWHGRGVKEDTKALRARLHTLSDAVNQDVGRLGNRVTRLEEAESNMGTRLARMEDKLDRLLERG